MRLQSDDIRQGGYVQCVQDGFAFEEFFIFHKFLVATHDDYHVDRVQKPHEIVALVGYDAGADVRVVCDEVGIALEDFDCVRVCDVIAVVCACDAVQAHAGEVLDAVGHALDLDALHDVFGHDIGQFDAAFDK